MANGFRSVWCDMPVVAVVVVLIVAVWAGSATVVAQAPTPSAPPVPDTGASGDEIGINPSYNDPGGDVESETERDRAGLRAVMLVTLLIWLGLFAYVVRLDRRVRRLEE